MIIGHTRKINKIEIHELLRLNDSDIKRGTNTKSLGIIVDERLNCERQYKTVHNKSCGGLQSLRKLKSSLPPSSLCNVYRCLIESHIRYTDVIRGSLSNTKMEFLQDRAVFMIHTSRIKDSWTPKFLSVIKLITFDRTVMVYKIFNKLCPDSNKFNLRSHHSRYNTRFCRNIQIPKYKLEHVKKGLSYSALKTWNEIPLSIREFPTLFHFKRQLNVFDELKLNQTRPPARTT